MKYTKYPLQPYDSQAAVENADSDIAETLDLNEKLILLRTRCVKSNDSVHIQIYFSF